MTQLFKPKVQVPDAPAAPPTINDAANAQDYGDRVRKRKGRASTVLVPDSTSAPASQSVLGG